MYDVHTICADCGRWIGWLNDLSNALPREMCHAVLLLEALLPVFRICPTAVSV